MWKLLGTRMLLKNWRPHSNLQTRVLCLLKQDIRALVYSYGANLVSVAESLKTWFRTLSKSYTLGKFRKWFPMSMISLDISGEPNTQCCQLEHTSVRFLNIGVLSDSLGTKLTCQLMLCFLRQMGLATLSFKQISLQRKFGRANHNSCSDMGRGFIWWQ